MKTSIRVEALLDFGCKELCNFDAGNFEKDLIVIRREVGELEREIDRLKAELAAWERTKKDYDTHCVIRAKLSMEDNVEITRLKEALEKDDLLCNAILEEYPKCIDLVAKVKYRWQQKKQALAERK